MVVMQRDRASLKTLVHGSVFVHLGHNQKAQQTKHGSSVEISQPSFSHRECHQGHWPKDSDWIEIFTFILLGQPITDEPQWIGSSLVSAAVSQLLQSHSFSRKLSNVKPNQQAPSHQASLAPAGRSASNAPPHGPKLAPPPSGGVSGRTHEKR